MLFGILKMILESTNYIVINVVAKWHKNSKNVESMVLTLKNRAHLYAYIPACLSGENSPINDTVCSVF